MMFLTLGTSGVTVLLLLSFFSLTTGDTISAAVTLDIKVSNQATPYILGENLLIEARMNEPGNQPRKDVVVKTTLQPYEGTKKYSLGEQTVAIETQSSFIEDKVIPLDIPSGQYLVILEVYDVTGAEKLAQASQRIIIAPSKDYLHESPPSVIQDGALATLGTLVLMFLLWKLVKRRRK